MKLKTFIRHEPLLLLAILIIPFIITSCDKNDGDEPDPLVGTYVFSGATFGESVDIVVQDYLVTFSSGSDASIFVSEGLLGAAPCDDSTNAAIEFRENGTSYYVCLTETNESQMGTWVISSDRTTFTLNISNPRTLALEIINVIITETSISGSVENFPLPIDTAYPLGEVLPSGINFQTGKVNVTFTRVP
ncbi:MAG: hypothetical protein AMS27_12810 [Bacteroides sp. SM23_62_1]|nr:MAG: hypothetical protein AMS27_12810 [Bacteroides sp. SM23_62_1]